MDFRLKLYWNDMGDAENAVTLASERLPDLAAANTLLETFQAAFGKSLTGSSIEQHVPGIGWVNADDVETVQIIARRREQD